MSSTSSWKRRLAVATALVGTLGAAHSAQAQQSVLTVPPSARTIRVSGIGEARAQPDAARMTFAVETFAATAAEAGRENARIMEQVVAALVAARVPRGEIETSNYTVYPEYVHDRPEMRTPRISGYRATNQVTVRTDELHRIGDLIDVSLNAGANRVDGVMFELRNATAAQAEATRNAVEQARASAQTIASALGVTLGEVLDASTTSMMPQPMPVFAAPAAPMMRDMAQSTPIQPGEQTVTANVFLIFAIR